MSSILVIKVKCGDTQRRFNFHYYEHEKYETNMIRLRESIRGLFSLSDDVDFALTYTDADGDAVTLVEDCDLDDVVMQGLNPVRMVVTLKTGGKGGSCNVGSSGNATTVESIESIQAGVEEVVKNVTEPLKELILKLTRDLTVAASAPVVADVINSASKIGESFACRGSQIFSQKESNAETRAGEGEISSGSNSNKNADLREERLADKVRKVKAKAMNFGVRGVPDLNEAPPLPSEFLTTMAGSSARSKIAGKGNTCFPTFANDGSSKLDVNPFDECPFTGTQVGAMFHPSRKGNPIPQFKRSHMQFETVGPVFHPGVQCDVCGAQPITGPRFISKVRYNYDLCSVCYQKSGSKAEYVRIDNPLMYGQVMKTFHHIQKIGGHGHKFTPFKPIADPYVPVTIKPMPLVNQVKLDSRFISDVNVMDGTVMAPSVRFTKIWRMKNTGNVVWPMGTQLVWIYGENFSNALSVNLEIPAVGLPVDSELDVAVDFVAPEVPGEYVSYWRMSSPSGQKFGQMVWVAIQVDGSRDPLSGDFSRLNLNLSPQNNGLKDHPIVTDVDIEPSMNNPYSPSNSAVAVSSKPMDQQSKTVAEAVVELFAEVLDEEQKLVSKETTSETIELPSSERNLNLPTNDTLPPVASSVSYPLVDSSNIVVGALPMKASSNVASLVPSPQSENFSETTEHEELSEMSINQVELDNEILKMMDPRLEQAHDFLCGMFGWDQILDELEKMGFSDKKKNTELVLKNKGSIKRVVMDLVAGEKSR